MARVDVLGALRQVGGGRCARHAKARDQGCPPEEIRVGRGLPMAGLGNSGGVRSAPLSAQMLNLPTKRASGRAGGASRGWSGWRSPPGKTHDN
eukprot:10251819-Alexandrium_andersonii.AAC.1